MSNISEELRWNCDAIVREFGSAKQLGIGEPKKPALAALKTPAPASLLNR
jgi:hypothetical protein